MTNVGFLVDALDSNRSGQLSAGQLRELQRGLERKHGGILGSIVRGFDPLTKDLQAGRVESVEGAMTKKSEPRGYGQGMPGYRYRISVANRELGSQEFRSPRDIYDFAPDAGMVRLFYLPRSRWIVNLELLPDAPVEDISAKGLEETARSWKAAREADDKVGEAEARAQVAAVSRGLESYLGQGVPSAGERSDPDRLTRAIIGSWKSPFLSVSFRHDGTFTARLSDGSNHEGRWSVDPDGRLHADVMGAPMVAEASVDADGLTLVLDDQALKLRRATSE